MPFYFLYKFQLVILERNPIKLHAHYIKYAYVKHIYIYIASNTGHLIFIILYKEQNIQIFVSK